MKYVIYLISKNLFGYNDYGYYAGDFTVNHEKYPVFDKTICNRTKRYTSRKRAENAVEKCFDKFLFVDDVKIEEVSE